MKNLLGLCFALLLTAACTTPAADDAPAPAAAQPPAQQADSMDRIAEDYVKLQLLIGEKEEGYIDAYYGPPEWREAARAQAAAATLPQLAERVQALIARIGAVEAFTSYAAGSVDARRSGFLQA